jgi:hypothetical protein
VSQKKARRDPFKTLSAREFYGEDFEQIIAVGAENPSLKNSASGMESLAAYVANPFWLDGSGHGRKGLRKAVRLLQDAGQKNDLERFRRLLYYLLTILEIDVPEGAIDTRFRRGAPSKHQTKEIIAAWKNALAGSLRGTAEPANANLGT